jgi:hypothetical protein
MFGEADLYTVTCFSFVIRPLVFPLTVQPRVVKFDPGLKFVWEGVKVESTPGIPGHFESKAGRFGC